MKRFWAIWSLTAALFSLAAFSLTGYWWQLVLFGANFAVAVYWMHGYERLIAWINKPSVTTVKQPAKPYSWS